MIEIIVFVFIICGWMFTWDKMMDWRDDARYWERFAQCNNKATRRDQFRNLYMDDDMCSAFARELEIQADGGDDPAEFVKIVAQNLGFSDGPNIS